MIFDYLIVGAGFSGSIVAERLAAHGKQVLVIDKRNHIGGNAYDVLNNHGVLIHQYGPHIFHTNSKAIFDYLSLFTDWRPYEHRVLAKVDNQLLPIPINLDTVNRLYGFHFNEKQLVEYFNKVKIPKEEIKNSEDAIISQVGWDLYEKFFKNYTKKQWGLYPHQLNASVTSRIPVRTNQDDRYFTDRYQFMPKDGYTAMFQNILQHPNIKIELETNFTKLPRSRYKELVYTGPIDSYFKYVIGKLPYRSLHFEHEHLRDINQYQIVGTINFPNDFEYTRITEFKHLTQQNIEGTSIVREYPSEIGEPYYPIPHPESAQLYQRYLALAEKEPNVHFLGRLAEYKYYNMDQAAGAALALAGKLLGRSFLSS